MIWQSILHLDLEGFVRAVGYVGVFLVIFAESGLFFGFFLPGASLLFITGLLASRGLFDIYIVIPLLGAAAILGDNVGYWFGSRIGSRIFFKEESLLFRKRHLELTKTFYDKYGARVILVGRFIPIVRTFAPILAGVCGMRYKLFFLYNVIGAMVWAVGVALAGYFLGAAIPAVERYLSYIIIGIIISSALPLVGDVLKAVQKRR